MKAALATLVLAGSAFLAVAPSLAQTDVASAERIRRVVVYGNDRCPRGAEGEVVICARRPSGERYRIPEEFRDDTSNDPASTSWATQAESMEFVGRTGIQSCSPVGPGGASGCQMQLINSARAERQAQPTQPR
ncbi:hypothetical protein [Allosphingosinicella deserti]|uniref:Uncharacterized protein n=1 Tax=Allosphingosinicella deserti TaxID=2116704 RepID=A0A2P7QZI3_9SPHN|nr:hypothetical protein [Sphingomonas deserti]PSJ43375.1 hypothetical protein C7I55_03150 [Sphingomonas deserti]